MTRCLATKLHAAPDVLASMPGDESTSRLMVPGLQGPWTRGWLAINYAEECYEKKEV